MQGYAQEAEYGVRSKKPFCNAFTGCGRKRADPDVAEGELLGMLAERIQGIPDQVTLALIAFTGPRIKLIISSLCRSLGTLKLK